MIVGRVRKELECVYQNVWHTNMKFSNNRFNFKILRHMFNCKGKASVFWWSWPVLERKVLPEKNLIVCK